MSRLNRKIREKRQVADKEKSEQALPVYEIGGVAPKKKKKIPYRLITVLCILFLLAGVIYLPEMLYKPKEAENERLLTADIQAVKLTNEYTRDCPDEDFDGDGLVNFLEQQHGTSSRRSDTDKDGVSDYAEIYLTETNPTVYDKGLLEKQIKKMLDEQGKKYSDPYKLEGVVLWADELTSRAFGSVVKTKSGYCISNFSGWVEFPEDGYAYSVKGDTYTLLEYKENSNAWRVEGDTEICLSVKKLSVSHKFRFIKWDVELPDNFWGKTLSFLLPDNAGLLICKPVAEIPEETVVKAEKITMPDYDKEDMSRFGVNHNSLTDLGEVYGLLDGGSCVLASLNSADFGETLILIYGYSETSLLIADPNTLKPVGELQTVPSVQIVFGKDESFSQELFFEFIGLGYDSRVNDRIHFICATVAG